MDNSEPICRICLQQPKIDTLMPTDSNFCSNIEQCTGVVLTQDADLPNKLCTSCALLLRAALKLRNLCQQAEEQLQKLKQEQQEQQMKAESDCDLSSEFLESYEVTLETGSTTGSQRSALVAAVTIKPSSPSPATVPGSKPKRHSRSADANKSMGASYACDICNNVYNEKVKLTAHLKVHSVHKPHECEICHKRFRQTPQLARHMNSHTGLRPYKCDYCDSSFADPSTRIKHQRIHTNERPYKCKYCSKSFAYSNVLNVHLKVHTGERPFSCQYCGRRFSQMHHKNTHERAHKAKDWDKKKITIEEE